MENVFLFITGNDETWKTAHRPVENDSCFDTTPIKLMGNSNMSKKTEIAILCSIAIAILIFIYLSVAVWRILPFQLRGDINSLQTRIEQLERTN